MKPSSRVTIPVRIAESDESKLGGGIDDQVLRNFAHMRHGKTSPHHELDDEIAIANTVEAVLGHGLKPKLLC